MCGFVGITGDSTSENLIINALKSIKHRGPDNEKIFSSSDIKLGFVRLAIQDVSDISNQPIYHPSKKFIIVFNGEIYNHLELRKFINSNKNKSLYSTSKSDTITLLGLIDELGIKRTLELIKGMFAIAVYFFEEKELFLIRDHFGQKPLFYTFNNGNIIFGSEIKAISKLQNRNLEFNLINTLLPVLQTHLPDNNRTIFKDIFSLMPGELLHIKEGKYKNSEFYFTPEDLVSEEI